MYLNALLIRIMRLNVHKRRGTFTTLKRTIIKIITKSLCLDIDVSAPHTRHAELPLVVAAAFLFICVCYWMFFRVLAGRKQEEESWFLFLEKPLQVNG